MASGSVLRVLSAALLLATFGSTLRGQSGTPVELMTVTLTGVAGGGESFLDGSQLYGTGLTNVSADNRFVVFSSASSELVAGDANGAQDVFVRDRSTGVTRLVSFGSTGAQANGPSGQPVISADGRYVAFLSVATNLVPGDTNQVFDPSLGRPEPNSGYDVFVRDLQAQTTVRVSVSGTGAEAEFGVANQPPGISGDGRYIVFSSSSRNLVPDDTNRFNLDVFVHDRATGTTERASLRLDGSEIVGSDSFNGSMSVDGRRVVFTVYDNILGGPTVGVPPNLTQGVYVRDLSLGQTILVSARSDGSPATLLVSDYPMISGSGRYVSFASWEDLDPSHPDYAEEVLLDGPFSDLFVRDLLTNTTRRASLPYPGGAAEESARVSAISGDGRFVAYSNGHDMVVRDMIANTSSVIRPPDGSSPTSYNLTISQDGRYAFVESFTDLIVPNDSNGLVDAFLYALPPAAGADLSVTLSANDAAPAPNSDVTFTVSVINGGGQGASGIAVAVPLPAGLRYVSDTGSGAYAGGTWTIPSLASGSTVSLQLVARVDTLLPVTLTAEIMTATPFDPDSTPGNGNFAEDDHKRVAITPEAIDLALSLNANTVTPAVNANVTLAASLSNTGNVPATGVAVRLALPAGLTFVSSSGTGGFDSSTSLWSPGVVAAAGSANVAVVARVATASPVDVGAEVVRANEVDRDSTPNNSLATEDDHATVHLSPVRTGIIVNGTTGTVNANDGKCTLVEAIVAANTDTPSGNAVGECAGGSGADVIHLRALTPPYVFTAPSSNFAGPTALPSIASDITIDGGGAAIERSLAAGTPQFRIFAVQASGRLVLDNVTVRHGYAVTLTTLSGGGIYNAGTLELVGSVVSNNSTNCDGAGIASSGLLVVRGNSRIHSNIAGCSGGGIATFYAGIVRIVDSTIDSNFAFQGGGGLFVHGTTTVTLTHNRIIGNQAFDEGGGIFTHNPDANFTITTTEIRNNGAGHRGGGISNGRPRTDGTSEILGGSMTISLSTIAENRANDLGGGIANAGSLSVTDSLIDRNHAVGAAGFCGGGIYSAGPLTLIRAFVAGNRSVDGGGICATGRTMSIVGGRIVGNEATVGGGGGILIPPIPASGPRDLLLADVAIEINYSARSGGGVNATLQSMDVLIVDHATIQQNSAQLAGGGLAVSGGATTLRNDTRLLGNLAQSGGGLIFHDSGPSTLVMQGGTVDRNIANGFWGSTGGGGIWSSARAAGSALRLNGVTLVNNRASTSSGGAIMNLGILSISNSTLSANDAESGVGGAIYTEYSTTISASTLTANRAVLGAGVYAYGGGASINNSTISGNVASSGGGAVDIVRGVDPSARTEIVVSDSTIVNNVGLAGIVSGANVQVYSSILAGNKQPDSSIAECRPSPGATAFFYAFRSVLGQDAACPLISGSSAEHFNRTIDPTSIFTNLIGPLRDNGGPTLTHALLPGSLAIDASAISSFATDQRGMPRLVDSDGNGILRSDAGALEMQTALPSPTPTLTSVLPATATVGAVPTTIAIIGTGFTASSMAMWNGSPRVTFAETPSRLRVQLLLGDGTPAEDVTTAAITVGNPATGPSNTLPFTIVNKRVSSATALAVSPGTTGTVIGAGVHAALTNNDASSPPALVTVALYSTNPTSGTLFAAGGFFDLQVTGAEPSDSVTATFYYPVTVTGAAEAVLQLLYWTGTEWAPVVGSGGAAPSRDTTDNPDGVLAGGRFTVTLDSTSTPALTALGGTVFALADAVQMPPRISGSGYNSPELPTYRATFSVKARGPSSRPGALKYSYARKRMTVVSTSVTSYVVVGSSVTLEGAATVNKVSGFTFSATASAASPNTFAIVIRRADGSVYFSAPTLPLAGGAFALTP